MDVQYCSFRSSRRNSYICRDAYWMNLLWTCFWLEMSFKLHEKPMFPKQQFFYVIVISSVWNAYVLIIISIQCLNKQQHVMYFLLWKTDGQNTIRYYAIRVTHLFRTMKKREIEKYVSRQEKSILRNKTLKRINDNIAKCYLVRKWWDITWQLH